MPPKESKRLLIIRFSSFGDIIQAVGIPGVFKSHFPDSTVDWLVRGDLELLLSSHPKIDRTISLPRTADFRALIRLACQLSDAHYTHVYDAHSNVRSTVVRAVFALRRLFGSRQVPQLVVVRSKERWQRWLLFRFRSGHLPRPYLGAESYLKPLRKWGINSIRLSEPQFQPSVQIPDLTAKELGALPKPWIALAPSAAWKMKRWPLEHWKALVNHEMREFSFLLFGGPEDQFLHELVEGNEDRVLNLAGKLSLAESAAVLAKADLVIANDTGLLHLADQMERPTIALIGPTAFGYPSHATSHTMEIDLPCKPCSKDGRGRCKNSLYQKCLVEIKPKAVAAKAGTLIALKLEKT